MNPAPISPGWALVAIALLWGLAGALDQPLDDGEPSEGPAIEQPAPAEPLLHAARSRIVGPLPAAKKKIADR